MRMQVLDMRKHAAVAAAGRAQVEPVPVMRRFENARRRRLPRAFLGRAGDIAVPPKLRQCVDEGPS